MKRISVKPTPSKHDHDRSEVWDRPELSNAVCETMGAISENLRRFRRSAGLSQETLAEKSGLHAKHVQRLEKGAANTTVATIAALAHGLGIKVEALVRESKKEPHSRR